MLERTEIRYTDFAILNAYIQKISSVKKNSSCSIAIESKWGNGKTEFIKSWEKAAKSKKIKTIYYDAWEYDNIESPLLPLLVKIAELTEDKDDKQFISYAKELLRVTYFSTAKVLSEKAFGKDSPIEKILTEGIDALEDYEIKNYYKDLEKEYSIMNTLSDKLKALVEQSKQEIYIFVDELDRCRPDFAIKTLELINHFFNFGKITYVFALDIEQLAHSIQKVYGDRIDAFMYMRKFFDVIYKLSSPDIRSYITGILKEELSGIEKNTVDINYICNLLEQFNLSLQDINFICKHIGVFLGHYIKQLKNKPDATKYYLYFLIIRHLYYVEYQRLIHGDYLFPEDKNLFTKILKNNPENLEDIFRDLANGGGLKNREGIIEKYGLIQPKRTMPFYKYMESIMNYSIAFVKTN